MLPSQKSQLGFATNAEKLGPILTRPVVSNAALSLTFIDI
ncbi:hypothetical protein HP15_p42g4 (plasmid) [Marinobacter adhaerens HP15]|uniref:Uncharacterized protein n=1 Tax=Marinobacter adhaerens (strain DSM 23420 / HP15) TaxID=225937 RepID=E4PRR4_MARAH|nr:hypothetical protein HP15_p42g4 [Marinobacter adhaerens HP15]